jgi:hypothetical protein
MDKNQKNNKRSWFSCILFFAPLVLLSGCTVGEYVAPEKEEVSFFTGEKAGISFFGSEEKGTADNSVPVNALLWRAALDIASYVPLDDIDTFAGSIVTEWHAPKSNPDRRLKLSIFVIGQELRSDGIKVNAYVQKRLGSDWTDAGRDEKLGRDLEGLILSRARELRAAAVAETSK